MQSKLANTLCILSLRTHELKFRPVCHGLLRTSCCELRPFMPSKLANTHPAVSLRTHELKSFQTSLPRIARNLLLRTTTFYAIKACQYTLYSISENPRTQVQTSLPRIAKNQLLRTTTFYAIKACQYTSCCISENPRTQELSDQFTTDC